MLHSSLLITHVCVLQSSIESALLQVDLPDVAMLVAHTDFPYCLIGVYPVGLSDRVRG